MFNRRVLLWIVGFALFVANPANAVYNSNISGTVGTLFVYAESDDIYLRLVNQPISHPGCNPAYFVITQDVPQNRRNQMLAVILAAKAAERPLEIGYDNAGDCAHGFIRVHRVG
jgi:hypothetical protein